MLDGDLEIIEDDVFKLAIERDTDTVDAVYFRASVIGLVIPKRLEVEVAGYHARGDSLVIDFRDRSRPPVLTPLEKVKQKQEELREAIAELEALQDA